MSDATAPKNIPFDPLDLRNYSLEKLPVIKGGILAERVKFMGVPLALALFCYFQFQWCGSIQIFEAQSKVPPAHCYSALAIFFASLVLWITEAIPNYLTSFLIIIAVILTESMKMRPAFAMLGEPVMVLNIASFIMASALVVTGVAKRLSLYVVLKIGKNVSLILLAFIMLNLILGAFISATSAKTALLLPLFMVIGAMYGATSGDNRNNIGRNLVLQNLIANNVSASAFMTGSAANLLAVQMLRDAGYSITYAEWFQVLFPLSVILCAFAYFMGAKIIFPIRAEDAKPSLEGGFERLQKEYTKLGPLTASEIRASLIFLLVLFFWATEKVLHPVRTETIALCGAIACLTPSFSGLPRLGVMKWNDADIPWHMLMFSWGAYVIGGLVDRTNIMGLWIADMLVMWGADTMPKVLIFSILALLFGLTTLINQSKTARTIIFFPIMIQVSKSFGWDVVAFCLPMAFLINQVYVLYFNSKPANISYLTNQYSMYDGFKLGFSVLLASIVLLLLWTQYVMPFMGYNSQLW